MISLRERADPYDLIPRESYWLYAKGYFGWQVKQYHKKLILLKDVRGLHDDADEVESAETQYNKYQYQCLFGTKRKNNEISNLFENAWKNNIASTDELRCINEYANISTKEDGGLTISPSTFLLILGLLVILPYSEWLAMSLLAIVISNAALWAKLSVGIISGAIFLGTSRMLYNCTIRPYFVTRKLGVMLERFHQRNTQTLQLVK